MKNLPALVKNSQASFLLLCLLALQSITHLAWLPISAHSGQVTIPWMMNQGKILFGDLLEQHAPASSFVAAFAQKYSPFSPITTMQMLNLLLVLVVSVLVYVVSSWLGRGKLYGIMAVLVWFWWEPVYGNILFYFDSVVGALFLVVIWIKWLMSSRCSNALCAFLIGVLLGLATVFKQNAWGGVIAYLIWMILVNDSNSIWSLIAYIIGVMMFPSLVVVRMLALGVFAEYFYWNWIYNLTGSMPKLLPNSVFLTKVALSSAFIPAFLLLASRRSRRKEWSLVGLMWIAGNATLIPRSGEIHVMGSLPLLAVMTGVVIAEIMLAIKSVLQEEHSWHLPSLQQTSTLTTILMGILLSLLLIWGVIGITPYIRRSGSVQIPAYDEFKPLAQVLGQWSNEGDTLFVLPETDSTPQIHLLSRLLPPGTWVKGWAWYLTPHVINVLLSEWESNPPDFIVIFPSLVDESETPMRPLLDFVEARYREIERVPSVPFHGDAVILKLSSPNGRIEKR